MLGANNPLPDSPGHAFCDKETERLQSCRQQLEALTASWLDSETVEP
jgi:hypothetical protein